MLEKIASIETPNLKWNQLTEVVIDLFLELQRASMATSRSLASEREELQNSIKNARTTVLKGDKSVILDFSECNMVKFELVPSLKALKLDEPGVIRDRLRALNL